MLRPVGPSCPPCVLHRFAAHRRALPRARSLSIATGSWAVAWLVVMAITPLSAQQSLSIVGGGSAGAGQTLDLDVRLTNTAPVEGFVLAIDHDPALVTVDSISTVGTATLAAPAELVIPEILTGGFTVGCVLDSDPPFDGQTIAPGSDQTLITFTAVVEFVLGSGDPSISTGFSFLDGALNNPPLDNIIVQGGQSIGIGQGLALNSAPSAITIISPPPITFRLESVVFDGDSGCVDVRMDNLLAPVQGYVLSVSHDPAVLLVEEVNIDGSAAEAANAELVVPTLFPNGATLGVVLDFQPPFENSTIPLGTDLPIATICYTCIDPPTALAGEPLPPAVVTDLTFVDGVFGMPPLENIAVVGGQSLPPILENGTVTCPPIVVPVEDTVFWCGPRNLPGNLDPTTGNPPPLEGTVGSTVELCFFYADPTDNLQGLQIAICHDCELSFGAFDASESIFSEVGAEFVNWGIDDDPNDGDGCEYTAGILLDALPPFANQTVPPTMVPLLIGCVDVTIAPTAACGTDLMVEFCDGIDGDGAAIIENIVISDFQSIQNFTTVDCPISVVPEEIIQRGDCNSDDKTDLADAATVIGWQFHGVSIICPAACDANDDGFINLADAVLLMNWLFEFGPAPPDPGPFDGEEGPDPTPDGLGPCETMEAVC